MEGEPVGTPVTRLVFLTVFVIMMLVLLMITRLVIVVLILISHFPLSSYQCFLAMMVIKGG